MQRRLSLFSVLLFATLLITTACGGGGGNSSDPTSSVKVSINPPTTNLLVRTSTKFSAIVTGASDTSVTFRVMQGDGGNILNTGEYLAPTKAGVYTVRATSVAEPSKYADAVVSVRDYQSTVTQGAKPADGYDYHTASLLEDGSILVVGGRGILEGVHQQAIRYWPSTNRYELDAALNTKRLAHVAFTLPNGKVVVAGGIDTSVAGTDFDPAFMSSEIYDPSTKKFSTGSDMKFPRRNHVATQLKDSRVLITGGIQLRGNGFGASPNTEIYDPANNNYSVGKPMIEGRWLHTATLLTDGRVLIVGGRNNNCTSNCPIYSLDSAEIFDPATGTFTQTGFLNYSRYNHTATLLSDGRVLILGGETTEDLGTGNDQVGWAEVYDPATGRFTTWTSLVQARSSHAVTLLNNEKLWVTGGFRSSGLATERTEFFDPATGVSVEGPSMSDYHVRHTAIRLPNGEAIVFSGSNSNQPTTAVEILK
jgi:hypothetical protein